MLKGLFLRSGFVLFGLTQLLLLSDLYAQTQVTTYVVKVQEEREQTRWTLTEWLKIKERMRMMDLWLALMSDPKKDKFQPELLLSYALTRGSVKSSSGDAPRDLGNLSGSSGKVQLWLTNLVSSTIGVRMLNIDLGGEFLRRQTGGTIDQVAATGDTSGHSLAINRSLSTQYYTGNLRIFGKSIQDSSIVLKYGRYSTNNTLLQDPESTPEEKIGGSVAGAELQLYVLKFLGVEGSYLRFGDGRGANGATSQNGTYADYMGFFEVSLLRLTGGLYQEEWRFRNAEEMTSTKEQGTMFGLKLQL